MILTLFIMSAALTAFAALRVGFDPTEWRFVASCSLFGAVGLAGMAGAILLRAHGVH